MTVFVSVCVMRYGYSNHACRSINAKNLGKKNTQQVECFLPEAKD